MSLLYYIEKLNDTVQFINLTKYCKINLVDDFTCIISSA